nr:hypothetical protein [Tanacetum cinerariifolium]
MRGPTGHRPPTERPTADHRYTTPTPMEPPHYSTTTSRRDSVLSDTTICILLLVTMVDREVAAFTNKIQSEVDMVKEKIDAKEENVKELEGKLEAMRSGPSLREVKEEEKSLLEKDVNKFNALIEQLRDHEAKVEKQMEEKEKLKLGNGFQYELNAKGSTPIEVLGDYKSTLKPGLNSSIEEVKRTKMEHLESKVRLQQVSSDIVAKIKAKEHQTTELENRDDRSSEVASHLAKKAHEFLVNAKAALQETTVHSEEEVQVCGYKLLALIDSVSKYKEFTASKISQMKDVVSETAAAIAQVHNDSLASSIGTLPQSEV